MQCFWAGICRTLQSPKFLSCVLRRETNLFQVSLKKVNLKSDTSIRKHPELEMPSCIGSDFPCTCCDHLSQALLDHSPAQGKLRRNSRAGEWQRRTCPALREKLWVKGGGTSTASTRPQESLSEITLHKYTYFFLTPHFSVFSPFLSFLKIC